MPASKALLAVIAGASLAAACSSGRSASVSDAAADTCQGSLADAGFLSLADLPVASLCAQSYRNSLEKKKPCQGFVEVDMATGVDCGEWWLFDAASGALQAYGAVCGAGNATGCLGAAPGVQIPIACFYAGSLDETLCPNAGMFSDAATD